MTHALAAMPVDHVEAAGFILRGIRGIFALIGSLIAAVLCGAIAAAKGRSVVLFAICGLFFSIITLIVVLVIPRKQRA